MAFKVTSHQLVTKHVKVSNSEKEKLLKKYNIDPSTLPKILKEDPAISQLSVKVGDIIKIERKSKTTNAAPYYRVVIED